MKKCIIIILLIFCMVGLASAYTEVEISVDNSTWEHLINTENNSLIIEGYVDGGINESTKYYFQLRHVYENYTSNWSYVDVRTGVGGVDEVELAIILVFSCFILLSAFLTFYLEKELKLVFLLVTFLLCCVVLNLLSVLAGDGGASAGVVNLLWFVYKMSLYAFWIMFFYVLVKLLMGLKLRKNPPPDLGSPLKAWRHNRKERKKWRSK